MMPHSETDNDYAGARYYASTFARWLSVDPAGGNPTDPQGLNPYGYVGNDPVNKVDRTGASEEPVGGLFFSGPCRPQFRRSGEGAILLTGKLVCEAYAIAPYEINPGRESEGRALVGGPPWAPFVQGGGGFTESPLSSPCEEQFKDFLDFLDSGISSGMLTNPNLKPGEAYLRAALDDVRKISIRTGLLADLINSRAGNFVLGDSSIDGSYGATFGTTIYISLKNLKEPPSDVDATVSEWAISTLVHELIHAGEHILKSSYLSDENSESIATEVKGINLTFLRRTKSEPCRQWSELK